MKNFPTKKNLEQKFKVYPSIFAASDAFKCYVQNVWKKVFDQVPISF